MTIHHDLLGFKLLKLWSICYWLAVNVIFEIALFDSSIGKLHLSNAVLNTMLPLSFVTAAISPIHLTVTMSFVIFVAALIHVSTLPSKSS